MLGRMTRRPCAHSATAPTLHARDLDALHARHSSPFFVPANLNSTGPVSDDAREQQSGNRSDASDPRLPLFHGELSPGPRLLLISYHFPPSQTAGALRWQKLSRYAAERGWGLDVVTLHPDAVANADWSRLDELPT